MKKLLFSFILVLCGALTAVAQGTMNVGIMLPLHNVDGDGRRMVEYYRGILLAVDQLKETGMNINVHAWNVNIDADPRTFLLQDGAAECNVIFGPLYTKQVKTIADFCQSYGIKMVIPFSINGNDVDNYPCIYQVYQSPDDFNTTTIKQISEQFANYHFVFIDCNDSTSRKGIFTTALKTVFNQKHIGYNITNVNTPDDQFAKAFSLTQPNMVIINSGRSPELTRVMDKLDVLTAANQNLQVTMFGYNEWLMYAKYNKDRFAKYNVYLPTNYYFNENNSQTKALMAKYRNSFGQDMSYALPHFALTGYDHAMYFIGKKSTWLQTPLNFQKTSTTSGYRNKAFYLVHYKPNGGIEAVKY